MEILLKFFGLIQMIYLKIVAIYFLWNILGKRHFINVIQMLTRMPVVLFSANFQCFHQLTAVNHFLKVLYLSLLGKVSSVKSHYKILSILDNTQLVLKNLRTSETRCALLVFSIEQPNGKLLCSLGNAHGTDTVTAIEICKNNNSEFRTIGRDGNVKKWRLNFNEEVDKGKSSLELISFSKLNFEWPCEFIKNYGGRSLIAGFQNNYFVLFDETTNSIISRKYLLGGGKRLWQLWMRNFLDNDEICLFYAQKGSFYCDILKPLFLNFVSKSLTQKTLLLSTFSIKTKKIFLF
uniref:Uncharacterized protein n=1 Tax=Meloidogyne enterolobii TaxID=390850 RepID=A0A6V7UML6_MELEN|nr:unnamed protein product [Meloidogyne enterolobii]